MLGSALSWCQGTHRMAAALAGLAPGARTVRITSSLVSHMPLAYHSRNVDPLGGTGALGDRN
jgi:hypothetical protein